MRLTYTTRLIHPWRFPERYDEMNDWINGFDRDECRFDRAYGVSYINGITYVHDLSFKSEIDLLMFTLKFPEFFHTTF